MPSHVEDALRGLSARGIEVAYLNTGAKTGRTGTHLSENGDRQWRTWNLESRWAQTSYWNGTVDPLEQTAPDVAFSRAIATVARDFAPDIVHFHELTAFPIAAAAAFRETGARLVFSAHDFFALCPTTKLQRPDGTTCDRPASELDCDLCSKNARPNRNLQLESAWDRRLATLTPARNIARRIIRSKERAIRASLPREAYQVRRHEFVRHLLGFDTLLMTSLDQMRRFRKYFGDDVRLHLLPLSRTTFAATPPPPRTDTVNPGRTAFLALNIVNSAKGLALLEKTFAGIASSHPGAVLHLYGPSGADSPGIRRLGKYNDSDLDAIIASADFGIIPSIWPEAYGYVGPEMLSRGLPVIASNVGAMPDYVVDEANGLLFDPKSPGALLGTIRTLLDDGGLRARLWAGVAATPRSYLMMDEHLDQLLSLYKLLLVQPSVPA
ncbi:MAG TPA: glycosyltransferase [Opitutaceae bacterium]|nr:glycosyltransferase [Opitutaceae bacterium]